MTEMILDILDLAAGQHGVLNRQQARELGATDSQIARMLERHVLRPVAPNVFAARGAPDCELMAISAAVLSTGGCATHQTAARLFRINTALPLAPLHVTVARRDGQPRTGRIDVALDGSPSIPVRVHRTLLPSSAIRSVDGIPTCDPERILFDLATRVRPSQLEAAFERARFLGLVSTNSLQQRLDEIGGRGVRGTTGIRQLLETTAPNALESELEVRAWRLLRRSGLPMPVRQYELRVRNGRLYRLDFAWPHLKVALEPEGFEWHGSNARWKHDKRRAATLEQEGWRIIVATWDDITRTPDITVDRVVQALAERDRRSGHFGAYLAG